MDSHSAKNASIFDEEEVPKCEPIPERAFHQLCDILLEANVYGWREAERDNGVLRKLWNHPALEWCSPSERRELVADALRYGIAHEDDGSGMPMIAFWAERRIENPDVWNWETQQ